MRGSLRSLTHSTVVQGPGALPLRSRYAPALTPGESAEEEGRAASEFLLRGSLWAVVRFSEACEASCSEVLVGVLRELSAEPSPAEAGASPGEGIRRPEGRRRRVRTPALVPRFVSVVGASLWVEYGSRLLPRPGKSHVLFLSPICLGDVSCWERWYSVQWRQEVGSWKGVVGRRLEEADGLVQLEGLRRWKSCPPGSL